jgi:hypothetical protein
VLHNLLFRKVTAFDKEQLEAFCTLDDTDVIYSIKQWSNHKDWTLSTLCKALLNRKLLKLRLQHEPIAADELRERRVKVAADNNITAEDASFLVFTGEAENSLYDPNNERINILFKDGSIRDIAQVDSPLIHQNLSRPVKKFYICFYQQ